MFLNIQRKAEDDEKRWNETPKHQIVQLLNENDRTNGVGGRGAARLYSNTNHNVRIFYAMQCAPSS